MKAFRSLTAVVLVLMVMLTAALNTLVLRRQKAVQGYYRVEAKRAADQIDRNGTADLSEYKYLTGIYPDDGSLYKSDEHYLIIEAGGRLWRVEYDLSDNTPEMLIIINSAMAVSFLCVVILLIYVRRSILKPFGEFTDLPTELAKGNLFMSIPEHKNRWFGKFTWGVEMLRDKLESSRRHELEAMRDKRLLLLSLSHDIKTPLSAIKLSAAALAKGLYPDPEKQRETAQLISKRAAEIEGLMTQIRDAANEDIIRFDVNVTDVFLDSVINKVRPQFLMRLEPLGTELVIEPHTDCFVICDPDRLAECLQNLVDNAIKYGDGRRITFSFADEEDCRLLTVSNTGCTLEEKELREIFESFKRGSNVGSAEGSGLGLYICRRLMTMMDGEAFADIAAGEFRVTLVIRKS